MNGWDGLNADTDSMAHLQSTTYFTRPCCMLIEFLGGCTVPDTAGLKSYDDGLPRVRDEVQKI